MPSQSDSAPTSGCHMPTIGNLRMIESGARFSPCRTWRYALWRRWTPGPTVLWLLLNSSSADETTNDPTVERCQRRTRTMEAGRYGGYEVCNIFALRSTDPKGLYMAEDPVGPENDAAIMDRIRAAERVICGWGNHGQLHQRGRQVLAMLRNHGITPECLKITGAGEPGHPLYIPYSADPYPLPSLD